ncbi:Cysteine protease ATG4 [Candida viswanathii]|uniref:Cysteine protease n=1 Tax=Candida viswanathii TaxID=5486 RepID=A0A367XZI9_9ASCO|nr:Cysteine protease ATG4 [Candida viswanathii]
MSKEPTENTSEKTPTNPPPSQDSVEEVDTVLGRFSLFVKDLSNGISNPSRDGTPSEEPATVIHKPTPIIVLGKEFDDQQEAASFIESKLWLSYRCGFDPIPKSDDGPQPIQFFPSIIFNKTTIYSNFANLKGLFDKDNFTSDAGWGCMIRTSQNLLANTLLLLLPPDSKEDIIGLFQDRETAPFSIHNFIRVASELPLQVKPGQWFGPNAASLSIKRLTDGLQDTEIKGVKYPKVFISENCDLYDDEMQEILKEEGRSVLILLPIRLGIDKVNAYYYNSIFQILKSKYSCGISGGKPSSSFYFLGYEDSELIYFDPHLPQLVEDLTNLESYQTRNYNKLNISLLDPSMMIGILLQSMDDYLDFKTSCIDNSNKIVHFHPHVLPSQQQDTLINQSWEEVHDEDEDFVNLNVNKVEDEEVQEVPEEPKKLDEFIDLGKQEQN